jgi:hypothetical protein
MYGLKMKYALLCGMISFASTGYGMLSKKLEPNRNRSCPVTCGTKAQLVFRGRKGGSPTPKTVLRGSGRAAAVVQKHIQEEHDLYFK